MYFRTKFGATLVAAAALGLALLAAPVRGSVGIPTAEAHSFIPVSVEYLAKTADRVVVALPIDEISLWEEDAGGRRIVTYHRLRVQSDVVGQGTEEIWVRVLGGIVGNVGQRVEGVATLRRDQSTLLFLSRITDGNFAVIGMEQGCFQLSMDKKKTMRISPRRFVHGPVRFKSDKTPISALEGLSFSEAKQLILEARKRHAK